MEPNDCICIAPPSISKDMLGNIIMHNTKYIPMNIMKFPSTNGYGLLIFLTIENDNRYVNPITITKAIAENEPNVTVDTPATGDTRITDAKIAPKQQGHGATTAIHVAEPTSFSVTCQSYIVLNPVMTIIIAITANIAPLYP